MFESVSILIIMLGKNQQRLLEYINKYLKEFNTPPTRREIMTELGFSSPSTVNYHLSKLQDKNFLRLTPFVDRGIEVIKPGFSDNNTVVPLLGTVSAGLPMETFSSQEQIEVPSGMISTKYENYALRVVGDSMIDEHICQDDIIIVRAQIVANNGDTVVALVGGNSATVKTIYFEKGYVRLQPANRDFKPIFIKPPQTLEVQGIVVGVLRFKKAH